MQLSWYEAYRISLAINNNSLENNSLEKEAGFKENLSGIALALSLYFGGGMDTAEAAQKANVPKEHVDKEVSKIKNSKQLTYNKTKQEKPAKPAKQENISAVSSEEQVARTLFAEAAGESLEGKKAVASVIWNRAKGNKDNLLHVVKAPRQFSCWNSGMPVAGTGNAWKDCLSIAKEMMSGNFTPITKHSHYYAPAKANPKWAYIKTKKGKVLRDHDDIGNHRFLTI